LEKHRIKEFIASITDQICKEQPDDVVKFTLDFLTLQFESTNLKKSKSESGKTGDENESKEDGSDEDDYAQSVAAFRQQHGEKKEETPSNEIDTSTSEKIRNTYVYQVRRKAFSSESINMDDIQNYKPPKVDKTVEERTKLAHALSKNALFAHFEKDDLEVLYDAMFPTVCKAGDVIMRQGDPGDNFYIVDSGVCDIFVKIQEKPDPILVKTCYSGDGFGELALMYGTPRAATIISQTDSKLWAIDRMTYRKIVMGRTMNKRELYEGFLKKVPLLQSMNDYERLTVADALLARDYKKGEAIIRQGDSGKDFFIITDGECQVSKIVEGASVNLVLLKKGDYFGELALLFDQPRAATVTANTDCRVITLDVKSFKLLLGPVDEILKRNTSNYEFYMKKQEKK